MTKSELVTKASQELEREVSEELLIPTPEETDRVLAKNERRSNEDDSKNRKASRP